MVAICEPRSCYTVDYKTLLYVDKKDPGCLFKDSQMKKL